MKKSVLCFFIVFSIATLFGVSDYLDSLYMPLEPKLSSVPEKITIENIGYNEFLNAAYTDFFFAPKSTELSQVYSKNLIFIANRLIANPDVVYNLTGYFSRNIDDILSPADLEKIADARVHSLREALMKENPEIVRQVRIPDYYDKSDLFSKDTSLFDCRAKLVADIPDFSDRSIIVQAQSPYIRTSYRDIIKSIETKVDSLLKRNPDLYLVFYAEGKPWDAEYHECYFRMQRASDFAKKRISPELSDRIFTCIGNSVTKPKDIDVMLVYAPTGACIDFSESDIKSLNYASETPDSITLFTTWNKKYPVHNNILIFRNSLTGQITSFDYEVGAPLDTMSIALNSNYILRNGENKITRILFDTKSVAHIAPVLNLNVNVKDAENFKQSAQVALFEPNSLEMNIQSQLNIARYSRLLKNVLSQKGRRKIVSIYSSPNENKIGDISISGLRASYLWEQVSSQLIVILELENIEDLEKWFKKNNAEISLESMSEDFDTNEFRNPLPELLQGNSGWINLEIINE